MKLGHMLHIEKTKIQGRGLKPRSDGGKSRGDSLSSVEVTRVAYEDVSDGKEQAKGKKEGRGRNAGD